jgi:hypothetical protein
LIFLPEDDQTYQQWISQNAFGFVINTRKNISPDYMVLHTSSCRSINELSSNASDDAFTKNGYIKICSDSIESLRNWVSEHGRPDGTFSAECQKCNPLNPKPIAEKTAIDMMLDFYQKNAALYDKKELTQKRPQIISLIRQGVTPRLAFEKATNKN